MISTQSAPTASDDVDVRERQRVAERDQLARPLRRHDPGELCGRERVALGQLAEALRRLGRHAHGRLRDGAPPRERLRADVDHADVAGLVDVREVAHNRRS